MRMLIKITVGLMYSTILLLFTACDWLKPEVSLNYAGNAVFNQDSSKVLILESRYTTKDPDQPYWNNTVSHREWQLALLTATPTNLGSRTALAVLDDLDGDFIDGAIQSNAVYWYTDSTAASRLFYAIHSQAVIRTLPDGQRSILSLPYATEARYFWNHLPWIDDSVPPDAFSILPSPDGEFTAVYYQIAVLGENIFADMDYYKCIAIFDRQNRFLAAWDPYTDNGLQADRLSAQLRVDPPIFNPAYDNPAPPGFQAKGPVASYAPAYFQWSADSRRLYVAGKSYSEDQTFSYQLDLNPGSTPFLTVTPEVSIPAKAIPVPGRAVSDEGKVLSLEVSENELEVQLYLHQLSDWTAHGNPSFVSPTAVNYAY